MSKLGWVVTAIIGIWLAASFVAIGVYIGSRNAAGPAAPIVAAPGPGDAPNKYIPPEDRKLLPVKTTPEGRAENRQKATQADIEAFVGRDYHLIRACIGNDDGYLVSAWGEPFSGTMWWEKIGGSKKAVFTISRGIVVTAVLR